MNISRFQQTGIFFLHNIPDIVVASPGAGEPTTVVIKVNGSTIFDEVLYADAEGDCTLCDVPSLLEPYVTSHASVSINGQTATVLYARLPIKAFFDEQVKVADWLKDNFLSPVATRIVSDTEPVCLFAANATDADLKIAITGAYYDQNGMYMTKSIYRSATPTTGVTTVLPLVFTLQEVQTALAIHEPLVGFSIALGERLYKFRRMMGYPSVTIRYSNSFGKSEYLSLQGALVTKPDISYTIATIKGEVRNMDVKSETVYQMQTGAIDTDTLTAIRDMVESKETYLVEDGIDFPIVFEEADLTRSNDKSELQGVTFSFRRRKDRGALLESFTPTERIFSEQFDWSFN